MEPGTQAFDEEHEWALRNAVSSLGVLLCSLLFAQLLSSGRCSLRSDHKTRVVLGCFS